MNSEQANDANLSQFDPLDFDPESVPVSDAATVMLVDDRPDLHVLMVRRTSKVVFAADNWVFPGGRVDSNDYLENFDQLCNGLSDSEASAILEVPVGGLAWWIAACRETLEEAGLLLAANQNGVDPELVSKLRRRVQQDEDAFAPALADHRIMLDASALEEVGRFITPVGSPRRFDARFFIARAPDAQEPVHDNSEIVSWEWMRPADALDRWSKGEIAMMSPTVRMIACLDRYRSADDAMAMAKKRNPYQRVRVDDPNGRYLVLLPGEPGYETADEEIETGWVRLHS